MVRLGLVFVLAAVSLNIIRLLRIQVAVYIFGK
jgi:hypothetical protein